MLRGFPDSGGRQSVWRFPGPRTAVPCTLCESRLHELPDEVLGQGGPRGSAVRPWCGSDGLVEAHVMGLSDSTLAQGGATTTR